MAGLSLAALRAQQQASGIKDESELYPELAPTLRQVVVSGGYLRILPAGMTIATLTEKWKADNWSGVSPWCRVEGEADHPEFEKNLKEAE